MSPRDIGDALRDVADEGRDLDHRSASAFEAAYAQRVGLSVAQLRRGHTVEPCTCTRPNCEGWRLVRRTVPTEREIYVDRRKYPTEYDLRRAVAKMRPRVDLVDFKSRTLRDGRAFANQGRTPASGDRGRPIWVATLRRRTP